MADLDAPVAAMPSTNPAIPDYFSAPASHGLPWQTEELSDRPGEPIWELYVEDISAWVHARIG